MSGMISKIGWLIKGGYRHYTLSSFVGAIQRCASKNSIFSDERELAMCSLDHSQKLEMTLAAVGPQTVLDLGCGTGKSLDWFLAHGVDAWGVEGSALARNQALHPELIQIADLNQPLKLTRHFDLLWCVEVVEHIHPKYIDVLMETLTCHADRVVLTAAHPGQGGAGHFNEQPASYWVERFTAKGFSLDQELTRALKALDEIFAENALAFSR